MSMRRRSLTVAAAAGILLAITAAGPANAAGGSGQTLGVGDIRCSDQLRSDNGARLTGFLTYGTGQWTVRRAATAGGSETVVLQAAADSLSGQPVPIDQTIAPPGSGDFFYRACLSIAQIKKYGHFSIANYQMSITSTSPDALEDIGPDTATLSPSALACGDQTFVSPGATVRLVGTTTGATGWHISVTGNTNNYEGNWAVLIETTTNIDRTVVLDPEITAVTACGWGADPNGKVSIAFELSVV